MTPSNTGWRTALRSSGRAPMRHRRQIPAAFGQRVARVYRAVLSPDAELTKPSLIESQPNFWPTGSLSNPGNAQAAATNLAAFRQKLVEELTKHPG